MIYSFDISIHALREEGDYGGKEPVNKTFISIHALREEGDLAARHFPLLHTKISIHALREEGDAAASASQRAAAYFYPRPPRGGRRGTALHCRRL